MRRRMAASGSRPRAAREIVAYVLGLGHTGDGTGHGLVGEDVFEEELCPALAVELGRPVGQWLAPDGAEQAAAPERQVDHHRHSPLTRQRQDALGRLAIVERIVHLHEIQRFARHEIRECRVLAAVGGRHADIADSVRVLQFPERVELGRRVVQVMHRNQVDAGGAQVAERSLDLPHSRFPAVRVHLGREEQRIPDAQLLRDPADRRAPRRRMSRRCRSPCRRPDGRHGSSRATARGRLPRRHRSSSPPCRARSRARSRPRTGSCAG